MTELGEGVRCRTSSFWLWLRVMRRPATQINNVEGGRNTVVVEGIAIELLVDGGSGGKGVAAKGVPRPQHGRIRLAHPLQIAHQN